MPNALSIANATSRKSRLSMPRSLMAWLSGVIFSRGISQVSEMMPATVSKVDDDIGASWMGQGGRVVSDAADCRQASCPQRLTARHYPRVSRAARGARSAQPVRRHPVAGAVRTKRERAGDPAAAARNVGDVVPRLPEELVLLVIPVARLPDLLLARRRRGRDRLGLDGRHRGAARLERAAAQGAQSGQTGGQRGPQ